MLPEFFNYKLLGGKSVHILAHKPVQPWLQCFGPDFESRFLDAGIRRTGHPPHVVIVGAVGTEEPLAQVDKEHRLVIGERAERSVSDTPGVICTSREKGKQKDAGLWLTCANLSDDGCMFRNVVVEFAFANDDFVIAPCLQDNELRAMVKKPIGARRRQLR